MAELYQKCIFVHIIKLYVISLAFVGTQKPCKENIRKW